MRDYLNECIMPTMLSDHSPCTVTLRVRPRQNPVQVHVVANPDDPGGDKKRRRGHKMERKILERMREKYFSRDGSFPARIIERAQDKFIVRTELCIIFFENIEV